MDEVKAGFEDLLARLQTDYIDIGMIHYIDAKKDFEEVFNGEVIEYVKDLKKRGIIKHIGISSHNPLIAIEAVKTGLVDVILFSINPCYDMLPPSENVDDLWDDERYAEPLFNIDPVRQELYELCQTKGVALTVMKAFGPSPAGRSSITVPAKAVSCPQRTMFLSPSRSVTKPLASLPRVIPR